LRTRRREGGRSPLQTRRRQRISIRTSTTHTCLRKLGEYERARQLDEDTLARRRRVLGDDHPDTLTSASNLAADLTNLGEHERAREIRERFPPKP
jgi:hypothetical protein